MQIPPPPPLEEEELSSDLPPPPPPPLDAFSDSDDSAGGVPDKKHCRALARGDRVDFFKDGTWVEAPVSLVKDERSKSFVYVGDSWVDSDSNLLAPLHSHTLAEEDAAQTWRDRLSIGDQIDFNGDGEWVETQVSLTNHKAGLIQVDGVWIQKTSELIAPAKTHTTVTAKKGRQNTFPITPSARTSMSYDRMTSIGAEPIREFKITKLNRFKVKQTRLIVLDGPLQALRVLDMNRSTRTEFAVHDIKEVRVIDSKQFKLQLVFTEGHRSYDIRFSSKYEFTQFSSHLIRLLRKAKKKTDEKNGDHLEYKTPTSTESVLSQRSDPFGLPLMTRSREGTLDNADFSDHSPSPSMNLNLQEVMADGTLDSNAPPSEAVPPGKGSYVQYHVIKRTKYNKKQKRIVVLSALEKVIRMLDENRKMRKEIPIDDVAQLELPKRLEDNHFEDGPVQISFMNAQRPFSIQFLESFDVDHFTQQLCAINPTIKLTSFQDSDASNYMTDNDELLRFSVLKLSKLQRKKRILYVNSLAKHIRWLNVSKKQTIIPISAIHCIEQDLIDDTRLSLSFDRDEHSSHSYHSHGNHDDSDKVFTFLFANTMSRSRCVAKLRELQDIVFNVEHDAPVSLFIGTWNLGQEPCLGSSKESYTAAPPKPEEDELSEEDEEECLLERGPQNIDGWIPTPHREPFDIYVIGLQECRKNDREPCIERVRNHITQGIPEEKSFVLVGFHALWQIVLMIFARKTIAHKISNVEMGSVATGLGDVLGNKGGCGISLFYEDTSLCFLNVHLAARAERLEQRSNNYHKIIRELRLGRKDTDTLSQFHHVFFFGDLNYRLEMPFEEVLEKIEAEDWGALRSVDQLCNQMNQDLVLRGFDEGCLDFRPTYRMLRMSNGYGNKRRQSPSWTDRILSRSLASFDNCHRIKYDGCPDTFGSDHRPALCSFRFISHRDFSSASFKFKQKVSIVFEDLEYHSLQASNPNNVYFLSFSAKFLETDVESGHGLWTPLKRCFSWAAENVRTLNPFVSDDEAISTLPILVFVYSIGDNYMQGDPIGCTNISLRAAAVGEPDDFSYIVFNNGVAKGRLTGQVSVIVNEYGPTLKDFQI